MTDVGTAVGSTVTAGLAFDNPEAYLSRDRRRALAEGAELPDRVRGAALFADISGVGILTDEIETTVTASGSGLQYDSSTGLYTYTWKTQKGWSGCRRLELLFVDGSLRVADFKFK